MEQMFRKWLADRGAEVDAMIFRSPQHWCADQYIFRYRLDGGEWSAARFVPWGMDTFARAVEIIEEATS
jgi:hypothetical protein